MSAQRLVCRRDGSQASGLEVLEGLHDLGLGVHDERPVLDDGLVDRCARGHEQFCARGVAWTYNGTEMDRATRTFGGYSTAVVVRERFVLKIPAGLDAARAAYDPDGRFHAWMGRVGASGSGAAS